MKTPRLFLGATLLFWGWQTNMPIIGAVMAVVIEASIFLPWRWTFTAKDLNKAADICAILFMALLIYRFSQDASSQTLLDLLQQIPIPFFPLLACQYYGVAGGIDSSALFYSARQKRKKDPEAPRKVVDIGLPFALACVLSASAANARTTFFMGFLVLSVWALWKTRPRRYRRSLWIPLILLAAGAGYAAQNGLHTLQGYVEQAFLDWYGDSLETKEDAYRTFTHLGDMGRLKLSHRIVMRILSKPGERVPALLRSASYNAYFSGNWTARDADFYPSPYDNAKDLWFFGDAPDSSRETVISMFLKDGEGLLSLPAGTYEIQGLKSRTLERNHYGAVVVDFAPRLAVFKVRYGDGPDLLKPPGPEDMRIPLEIASLISSQVASLPLEGETDLEKVRIIQEYFLDHFKYTLDLDGKGGRDAALARFLLDSKKGHCEFFAAATALFLRNAGIPARYATGYAVIEPGPDGQWLVRARHAHAWALAYVEGRWRDVDSTPSIWAEEEKRGESFFQGVFDAFSNLWWRISLKRLQGDGTGRSLTDYLLWGLIPLAAFLVWRLYRKERVERDKKSGEESPMPDLQGGDSEFYPIEEMLNAQGYSRRQGENLNQWALRLGSHAPGRLKVDVLREIIHLHYRYRFDPAGLDENDRRRLAALAKEWLESYTRGMDARKEKDHDQNFGNDLQP